jgi:hypothetical protein
VKISRKDRKDRKDRKGKKTLHCVQGDKKRVAQGDKKRVAQGDKKRVAQGDKKRVAQDDTVVCHSERSEESLSLCFFAPLASLREIFIPKEYLDVQAFSFDFNDNHGNIAFSLRR